ncbi:MAG: ATP-binding protein [Calothrix sp. MO_192.B10]|nr:ATP-binding protein [Calothrix sp. MO_192.B10]MDJ0797164.1 ATP-binding protein [Calothrix sp. MO_167.B12]
MASINEIIKREVNPFDLVNIRVGNFWTENQDTNSLVDSIHQEVITEIEGFLDLVRMDNRSRTLLLIGDSGSGKSYLLGRLKRNFNPKAFFTYIGPWADNEHIWRHILRSTVDSLIKVPEGQTDSQLMLWLKSLSAFTKRSLKQRILDDSIWKILLNNRQNFIKHLKDTYQQESIYNPEIFFGILHDLTNPELYPLACEWLRGDNFSEESMQALKVKFCIDSEDAAKNILANFGKISTETQPIVLCFDQVESTANWESNPQPIFSINTAIHNESLKNFLIVISIVRDPWMRACNKIFQCDKARIEKKITLRSINLDQAESIWAYRLQPLHKQANSKPDTPIYPLTRQLLEETFPRGKTYPRNTIILGREKYQLYKIDIHNRGRINITLEKGKVQGDKTASANNKNVTLKIEKTNIPVISLPSEESITQAEFQLIWQKELVKTQKKIQKISLLSAPDLIGMLQSALSALQINSIKQKLIAGKYNNYSFSYQSSNREKVGIVWTEDSNMNSFFHVMNASQKVITNKICHKLFLIRLSSVGNGKLKGYQLYQQIFRGTHNTHIKPHLSSVHQLATYQNLVNSSLAQELVISGKTINVEELQSLSRESKILQNCVLLQELGVMEKPASVNNGNGRKIKDLREVKNFLSNLVITQHFMGIPTLVNQAISEFDYATEEDVKLLIKLLCQERKVKIINPKGKLQDQLICVVT